MSKRRPGLLFGDPLCECGLESCEDHTMTYGKMCAACQNGEHRKSGDIHTRVWYEQFYGAAPKPIEFQKELQ